MSKEAFKTKKLTAFWFEPDELNIATEPTDPLYDSRVMEKIDDAFVQSIIKYGIIQPVVISKRDEQPWVTAGRRRTLGARIANERLKPTGHPGVLVPCVYKTGNDELNFERMVAENEHRKPDNVINKAEKCQRLIDMGRSVSDIANIFGVSTQTINNWLSLLELPKSERDAIIAGEVSAHAAMKKKASNGVQRTITMKKKKDIKAALLNPDFETMSAYDALRWVLGENNE